MLTVKDPKNHDWAGMTLTEIAEGNAQDAFFTLRIFDHLMELLQARNPKVLELYKTMLSPLTSEFADIELEGLPVSLKRHKAVDVVLKQKVEETHDYIYELDRVLTKDSMTSTQDLVKILYTREGGLELYPPAMTSGGKPSTNKETLETLEFQIEQELESRL